jgi:SagB-type dehydrogenase family enzyme
MSDIDPVPATEYHEQTKHSPESIRSSPGLNFENKPTPYKRYLDRPRVSFPSPPGIDAPALEAITVTRGDPADAMGVEERVGLDRDTVAGLCHYAAGITKEIERRNRTIEFRAAACTGALYHVDLYLACGDLPGLDAGVYHYDPENHALDVLREGDFRETLAAAMGEDPDESPPLTVVLTSEWWRNAWKYWNRTFRHAFWDSGTVAANLLAAAIGQGLPASIALSFADDRIVDLIGLDPAEEAPIAVVPIGERGSEDVERPDGLPKIDYGTAPLSPDPKEYALIHRAWRAGVLPDGGRAADWRSKAASLAPVGTREPGDSERIELDPVDRDTATVRPLDRTIRRRGSCREYDRERISFRKFSTVLDRAVRGTPLDVRTTNDAQAGTRQPLSFCDCYLIVNGVEDLPSGSYQYHPAAGELELLEQGECREDAGRLALGQQLGADAAVCAYFMTDIEAVTDALGDRGYRLAQFESSLTAGRLYLATYAHRDLGGTGLTFFDDEVTEFFSPRAAGQTPTFLYTLGRPA